MKRFIGIFLNYFVPYYFKVIWVLLACGAISTGAVSNVTMEEKRQSNFYISSKGNDSNPGTMNSPWRSVSKLDTFHYSPNDSVFFEYGSKFTGGFKIKDSGEPGNPIVFTTFGSGEPPRFSNPDFSLLNGNVIQASGSYLIIDGLNFHDCATVDFIEYDSIAAEHWRNVRLLGAIYLSAGSDHNIIKNCEIDGCPVGIKVYGQHNLITKNYIHDSDKPLTHHWGPMGIVVCSSHNEISYNRFENLSAPSVEYGHDGGAIEIDDRKQPKQFIEIHHNYSKGNQGFIEFVGRCKQDNITVHHNVSDDYQSFVGFTGPCTNIKIENNTVIRVLAHEKKDSEDVVFWSYFDNSEIIVRNNIFYYDPSAVEPVYSRGWYYTYKRDHNLYYRIDNPRVGDFGNLAAYNRFTLGGGAWLEEGEIISDPMFVDFENRDLRLRSASPAIDAGCDIGYLKDFNDQPILGNAPDMGAFECQ